MIRALHARTHERTHVLVTSCTFGGFSIGIGKQGWSSVRAPLALLSVLHACFGGLQILVSLALRYPEELLTAYIALVDWQEARNGGTSVRFHHG